MQKPINRDIYESLRLFADWKTSYFLIEEYFENDRKWFLIYNRLLSEKYIYIEEREWIQLKKEYEDKIDWTYLWEETITKEWGEAPLEWYDKKCEPFINLTLEWKIFLENYSNFWKKINYRFEDYSIIMPLIFGFLWGILSSLFLYLIIWK